jgi:salicylate hydroxylase
LSVGRALVRGRIALLGDAAHPVLPFLAQGGVLALEDAVVLARALDQAGGDVARGLRDYERRRRSRVLRVARASRLAGRIYHMSGALAFVRNAVLARAGPERMMAAYDWLYGWTE